MKHDETRSKIVCTIGPASQSKTVLTGMIEAGMDVARLNMSHATAAIAKKTFDTIRSIDDTVAVLFDLQGPKIRIGELVESTTLKSGQEFVLSTDEFIGTNERVSISHKELTQDVKPGDTIAINDGIIRLKVKSIKGEDVITEVIQGGPISSRKGVNIPGIKLSCKIPTEEDLKDLELAAQLEPEYIALSFVTERDDIVRLRYVLESSGPKTALIISKIEHILAIKNFDEILDASDGVMIARGDLGIEVPIEDVPILQRDLIRKANIWAKPAIVATHMLESMTTESMPTRAEVSDVAHAILDRADAVMLSGETAIGHDPVGAVVMMNKIIKRMETRLPQENPREITSPQRKIVEIIGNLVYRATTLIPDKIDGIVTATRSGYTARWISKFRPPAHIYTVTSDPRVMRQLRLVWGVQPIKYDQDIDNVDELAREAVREVHKLGYLDEEKDIIFTSGTRFIAGRTNIMGVFHVKDLL